MTRAELARSFGEKTGARIADELGNSDKGSNPEDLYASVSLATPENEAFIASAQASGYDVRMIAAPAPAPPSPRKTRPASKTLGQLQSLAPR